MKETLYEIFNAMSFTSDYLILSHWITLLHSVIIVCILVYTKFTRDIGDKRVIFGMVLERF